MHFICNAWTISLYSFPDITICYWQKVRNIYILWWHRINRGDALLPKLFFGILFLFWLWKESLNTDGQQTHHYKKLEQRGRVIFSFSFYSYINHRTQKKQRHITLEIQVLAWDRYSNVAELNKLMASTPNLDNWISNSKTIEFKTGNITYHIYVPFVILYLCYMFFLYHCCKMNRIFGV